MAFVSGKQQRWFFANLGSYYKKLDQQLINWYNNDPSFKSSKINREDVWRPTGNIDKIIYLINKDFEDTDEGWASIADQMEKIKTLPLPLRILADYRVTIALASILALLVGVPAIMAVGLKASFTTAVTNFARDNAFRTNAIRGNLVRVVIKAREQGIDYHKLYIVIRPFKEYLPDASSLARWAFFNAN